MNKCKILIRLAAVVWIMAILDPTGAFECETRFPAGRNAVPTPEMLWPGRRIAYKIHDSFSPKEVQVIKRGISMITAVTCLKFEEKTDQKDWVFVKRDEPGCWAHLGRIGGRQWLNLGNGCMHDFVVAHEFLHSIGLEHEHTRIDRDSYILVNYSNILPEYKYAFHIYQGKVSTPYDYGSLQHYGTHAFAKDRRYPTLIPIRDPKPQLGGTNLTKSDAAQINALYECNN